MASDLEETSRNELEADLKKSFCKKTLNPFSSQLLIAFTIFIIIAIMPNQLMATEAGGMINENTVWGLAGSPFIITSDVQVNDGVTLTIEPGVEVNGNHKKILNAGNVLASGLKDSIIVFKDVVFENANYREYAMFNFDYCHLNVGSYFSGWFSDGILVITNSVLTGPKSLIIYLLGIAFGSDEKVELDRNIFIDIGMLDLKYSTTESVRIVNNVFTGNSYLASNGGFADIRNNSFLNKDISVIRIDPDFGDDLTAINNFWNTTNTTIIESMIFDGNDDLNITEYVTYDPFLTAPHPDTPQVAKASFTAYPIVGKAPLEVNFTDQSAGEIISWEWDFGDGSTSIEQNPSHTYTNLDNYKVKITVADIYGIQDTYSYTIKLREINAMPWIPLLLLDE